MPCRYTCTCTCVSMCVCVFLHVCVRMLPCINMQEIPRPSHVQQLFPQNQPFQMSRQFSAPGVAGGGFMKATSTAGTAWWCVAPHCMTLYSTRYGSLKPRAPFPFTFMGLALGFRLGIRFRFGFIHVQL